MKIQPFKIQVTDYLILINQAHQTSDLVHIVMCSLAPHPSAKNKRQHAATSSISQHLPLTSEE
jgi:hypothetical protein